MRSFWEQTGVLGPIYRSLGEGLNEEDIAVKLDLTEAKVRGCIAWIVRFLELKGRQELVLFNLFNRVNLGSPQTCVDCQGGEMIINTAFNGRALQRQILFSLRLQF